MSNDYFIGYTSDFKTEVAIEALKEKIPIAKLAKKYNIEPFLIRKWKLQFIDVVDENLKIKSSEIKLLKQKLESMDLKLKKYSLKSQF